MNEPTYVLGVNESHDSSAALVRDGTVVAAIAQERLSRIKHDSHAIRASVLYVLAAAGVDVGEISLVVSCNHGSEECSQNEAENEFKRQLDRDTNHGLYVHHSHHELHAFGAFYTSPFARAGVLVCDGMGSSAVSLGDSLRRVPLDIGDSNATLLPEAYFEAESLFRADGSTIVPLLRRLTTHSSYNFEIEDIGVGRLYNYVSREIFGDKFAAGKVMALASYAPSGSESFLEPGQQRTRVSRGSLRCFTGAQLRSDPMAFARLARTVQDDLEEVVLNRARELRRVTGLDDVCLSGGVALNCPANTRVSESSGFSRVYVMPAATDDGIAIGAALYGYHNLLQHPRRPLGFFDPYLGREYARSEVDSALRNALRDADLSATEIDDLDELCVEVAMELANGKVVAWYQGGAEFGPARLGNRSLLASPTLASTRDHINRAIKGREWFRPLAPCVLSESVADWFQVRETFRSPYMLFAEHASEESARRAPAVVHVDGTARVQTVDDSTNPRLARLLKAFGAITSMPMLLNTSLNLPNEPIAETPTDALHVFLGAPIDLLVLGNTIVRRTRSSS